MGHLKHILLVEDDPEVSVLLIRVLEEAGYSVSACGTAAEALQAWRERPVDCAVIDLHLPDRDGISLMKSIKTIQPSVQAILITGETSTQACAIAKRAGAFDYFTKPLDMSRLVFAVGNALRVVAKDREITRLRHVEHPGFEAIIGRSPAIRKAAALAERVAAGDTPVVLLGEGGCGQATFARAMHDSSPRSSGPFVTFNCAAVAPSLLESELFGHDSGENRAGAFEEAHQGTLYLEALDALSSEAQIKLLRLLQTGSATRIDSAKPFSADVRIIAATHQDLEAMMDSGKFRNDLFYRLAVVTIRIPPLRERCEDVPPLANYFLEQICKHEGTPVRGFSQEALDRLMSYPWPGNVRELQNVVTQAVLVCAPGLVQPEHLPERILRGKPEVGPSKGQALDESIASLERWLISDALARSGGDPEQAARLLKTTPEAVREKISKYGLASRATRTP